MASTLGTELTAADVTGRTGKTAVVIVLGRRGWGWVKADFAALPRVASRFQPSPGTALEVNVHTLPGELGCFPGLYFSHEQE